MKTIITVASAAALAAAASSGATAGQARIETDEDLAVCAGIYLALHWVEPLVDRTAEEVGDPVTVYVDDEYTIRRAMERDFRRGEATGMIDAWNAILNRYKDRGCNRDYYVSDKRAMCEALRLFNSSDKRLMNCPD
ncbi:MAG: hypothetical protein ABL308_01630 [Oceanicaulis sp.]